MKNRQYNHDSNLKHSDPSWYNMDSGWTHHWFEAGAAGLLSCSGFVVSTWFPESGLEQPAAGGQKKSWPIWPRFHSMQIQADLSGRCWHHAAGSLLACKAQSLGDSLRSGPGQNMWRAHGRAGFSFGRFHGLFHICRILLRKEVSTTGSTARGGPLP